MSPHEGEEDPAVYRSGSQKQGKSTQNGENRSQPKTGDDESMEDGGDDSEGDEGDDGILLTVQPAFNRLSIILREKAVLHFVKYVSASAAGSRWDVSGEYTVSLIEDSDDKSGDKEEEWYGFEENEE